MVESTRAELIEAPLPPSAGPLGCAAAVVGLLVMVGWPRLVEGLPFLSFFTPFVLLFAVLGLVGGPAFLLFGGQTGRAAARAAIEASLRVLEDPDAQRAERLRASTVLLQRAYLTQGPATERILDVDEARRRIGPAMAVVLEVERHLADVYGEGGVFEGSPGREH